MQIHTLNIKRTIDLLCLAYKPSHNLSFRDIRPLKTRAHKSGGCQLAMQKLNSRLYALSYTYISYKWWNELSIHEHQFQTLANSENI